VLVIFGTRAFRDRVPGIGAAQEDRSTTVLGSWYATLMRWRRPVALFVNEPTLLPLLMPLAPARTLLARVPGAAADLLAAHRLPTSSIEAERAAMTEVRLAPTANRRVVGVLNEFAFLADVQRGDTMVCSSCRCSWQRHRSARSTSGTSARIGNSPRWSRSVWRQGAKQRLRRQTDRAHVVGPLAATATRSRLRWPRRHAGRMPSRAFMRLNRGEADLVERALPSSQESPRTDAGRTGTDTPWPAGRTRRGRVRVTVGHDHRKPKEF
jgi:hypothetical protein